MAFYNLQFYTNIYLNFLQLKNRGGRFLAKNEVRAEQTRYGVKIPPAPQILGEISSNFFERTLP